MQNTKSSEDAKSQYGLLTEACDRLLTDANAHPSWLATSYLHVISGHPVTYRQYWNVTGGASAQRWLESNIGQSLLHARNLVLAVAGPPPPVPERCEVLLVGSLVSEQHLEEPTDFYFGHLQAELADRGVRSLLLLRNHTRLSFRALQARAARSGMAARAVLPDVLSSRGELEILFESLAGSRRMNQLCASNLTVFQEAIRRSSVRRIAAVATTASLRLERQVEEICRAARPNVIVTTYEGHAWERCAWRGARRARPAIVCAGYQHTIMRQSSHAMRRPLGGGVDPDVLLCMGEITRDELAQERWLSSRPVRVLGTHRRGVTIREPTGPVRRAVCLVLPEGIREEADILVRFALEAAACLPATQFILRSHPLLSPEQILNGLASKGKRPANVEVSEGRSLDDDLARSGSLLYRGSSTVVYGVLAGLKPFYVDRPGEITLDPLYKLAEWKVRVESVQEFKEALAADEALSDEARLVAWQTAASVCRRYAMVEQAQCVDWLAEMSRAP